MDSLSTVAAGGLRTRMDALDLLANNIANASTPGFKADREFYSAYASAEAEREDGATLSIPELSRKWTDFSQGTVTSTGNSLDLALSDQGFFLIEDGNSTLLTRNGGFRVAADGTLETAEGKNVKAIDDRPLKIDTAKAVSVAADGTVTQDGQVVGRIRIVDVDDPQVLTKEGHGYFRLNEVSRLRAAGSAQVLQGKLETANVSAPENAVRLIGVMRQFEMLQRAAGIGSDMNRRAIEEVAKVTG